MSADGTYTGPRVGKTITTAAELIDDVVIRDRFGDIGVVKAGRVHYPETAPWTPERAIKKFGPLTVLFRPDAPQPATGVVGSVGEVREALADAWDEGYDADGSARTDNPYRQPTRPTADAMIRRRAAAPQPAITDHPFRDYDEDPDGTCAGCGDPREAHARPAGAEVDREALVAALWDVPLADLQAASETMRRSAERSVGAAADRVLAVLAARGDAATTTEVEWGVRLPTGRIRTMPNEAAARRESASLNAVYARETHVVQRTVSAWREVTS